MKKLIVALITMTSIAAYAQTYKVDPTASKVVYVGKKINGEHTGTITLKNGNLLFKGDELVGGEFVADMNSLTSTDITDPEYNAKYVSHMKSPDFFDTEKFSDSKLVIKSSKKTPKGLEVKADLTMIGVTKPISFVITDLKKDDKMVSGKSSMILNRTDWGLKYGSKSFFKNLGDKVIYDDFNLTVELTAKK